MRFPIYLDYMATTPVDAQVIKPMLSCLEYTGNFGNPASTSHSYGWKANEAVQMAREQVAAVIHADPKEIIWTSGATEANNLAIQGAARFYARSGKHIITLKTEHKAVLDVCRQLEREEFEITYLTPSSNGILDIKELENAFRPDTILMSLMHVNNEIGVIQDIASISQLCKARGVLLHVDAAQSIGKIAVNVKELGADYISFSAHKCYGPKGIGALYVRRQPRVRLQPFIFGGGHEQGLRSGTLATHQIVGMATAFTLAESSRESECQRILSLRNRLWSGINQLKGIVMHGDPHQRVAHNLNIGFEGVDGEALMIGLKDIAVSHGSACTSATIEPSHVLLALGISDHLAHSSLRFSLGRYTTEEEIDFTIQNVHQVVTRLRELSPLWLEK